MIYRGRKGILTPILHVRNRGVFLLFKIFILFIFRKRGGREKERERNINWLPLACHQLGTWPTTHPY